MIYSDNVFNKLQRLAMLIGYSRNTEQCVLGIQDNDEGLQLKQQYDFVIEITHDGQKHDISTDEILSKMLKVRKDLVYDKLIEQTQFGIDDKGGMQFAEQITLINSIIHDFVNGN